MKKLEFEDNKDNVIAETTEDFDISMLVGDTAQETSELNSIRFNCHTIEANNIFELQLAMYSKRNLERYLEATDSGKFIKDLIDNNPQSKKMMQLIEHTAIKLFDIYNEKAKEILNLCTGDEKELSGIYLDDKQDLDIRVLFKKISLVLKWQIEPDMTGNINSDIDILKDRIESEDIFFLLATLFYIHQPFKDDKEEDTRFRRDIVIKMMISRIRGWELVGLREIEFALKKKTEKSDAEQTKLKNRLSESKALNKQLRKDLAETSKRQKDEIKKTKVDSSKKFQNQIESKNVELKNLGFEFDEYKKNTVSIETFNKMKASYDTIQIQIKRYQDQINELRTRKSADTANANSNLMISLEKYLKENGMTDELLQIIYPYYQDYMSGIKPQKSTIRQIESEEIMVCIVEDHQHYCMDLKGYKHRLFNVPSKTYLAQNQFVLVNQQFEFVRGYPYRFEEKKLKTDIIRFVEIADKDCANNTNSYKLQKGQIVAVDCAGEINTTYRRLDFIIDNYLDSIRAKKHKVYVAVKRLTNGLIVKNYPYLEESCCKPIDMDGVTCPSLIILDEEKRIVQTMDNLYFVTLGKDYPSIKGQVEMEQDRFFVKKENGERYILRNTPQNDKLETGDLIEVDEFNQYLRLVSEQYKKVLTDEQKKLASKKQKPIMDAFDDEVIEIKDKTILIIGNIKLAETYKLKFLKYGYRVQVVDGYETYHKIQKEAIKADHIMVVTDCLSHVNYDRIKKDFSDIMVHADNSGSNRVLDVALKNFDINTNAELMNNA